MDLGTWGDQPKHLSREYWAKETPTGNRKGETNVATLVASQGRSLGKVAA